MTEFEAKACIWKLAETEFDLTTPFGDERPIWTPQNWEKEARDEGRPHEAKPIAEALRVLGDAVAMREYQNRWYQALAGYR